jgi:prepilin-type N-terminal cleavage/methylation domain-containing protein
MAKKLSRTWSPGGFTLIEGIVVTAIMAIIFSVALMGFRGFSNPLENQYSELISLIRLARIKAMQNTAAYRLSADAGVVRVEFAPNCTSPTWSSDPSIGRDLGGGTRGFRLSDGVSMTPASWILCFTSRGSLGSPSNLTLNLSRSGNTRSMQVHLGGGVARQ